MEVRIRIRIWIRIQDSDEGSYQNSYLDSFEGSYHLFYTVSLYFGATFQIAFEKYTSLNRSEKYLGS